MQESSCIYESREISCTFVVVFLVSDGLSSSGAFSESTSPHAHAESKTGHPHPQSGNALHLIGAARPCGGRLVGSSGVTLLDGVRYDAGRVSLCVLHQELLLLVYCGGRLLGVAAAPRSLRLQRRTLLLVLVLPAK